MRDLYIFNIKDILAKGSVENVKIKRTDLLQDIILKSNISDKLYESFKNNLYTSNLEIDDIPHKTQDMVYRIHLMVNELLVTKHQYTNPIDISFLLETFLDEGIDFFSAVDYDYNDKEILEEFDSFTQKMRI